jgi:hypothetical protein
LFLAKTTFWFFDACIDGNKFTEKYGKTFYGKGKLWEENGGWGPPGLQTRLGGAAHQAGHATWVCLGLGGRLRLSFDACLYIPRKSILPVGWSFS